MISKELAQKVANQVMKDIDYNINVMDDDGRIIASGDAKRIGDIHQGAKKVMASKTRNVIYEDTETEKKGINDPIFINDECVGVVGISGNPADVMKIKNVVNSLFYFLISREIEMTKQFSEKEYRQKMIRKMIYQEKGLTKEEQEYLIQQGFDYHEEKYIIVTDAQLKPYTDRLFYHQKSSGLLVLILSKKQTDLKGGLSEVLKTIVKEMTYCGVSLVKDDFYHGYHQARGTLAFIKAVKQSQGIHFYEENRLFVNVLREEALSNEQLNPGILRMRADEMLCETLLSFFEHDGHMKETAEALIIHRNTLLYRLNKIKELTGIDPTTFKGLSNLIYGLVLIEKNKGSVV
ncbi:CdaR family transcriptional regulator [Vagococcus zengguangii]|uniref:Carbohydrate diacid regulator n=1 Tax=Vagococcus zengguangii TaxID=2571750 RepID=A0A4D7CRQ5_9ENTE|nr:sugar diacid recognition domain-containing protein [Vagococcus zengguangii]QCI85534.1 hypothetical protein FA707_00480 [Vagococcus zengguangii]